MRLINTDLTGIYTGENIDGMVKEYMRQVCNTEDGKPYVPNTTIYKRKLVPEFKDPSERSAFWEEQIRLWRYGEGDMPGMLHTYFHHAWIRKRSGGRIRPGYRRHDAVTFDFMESLVWGESRWFGDRRGTGAIELGKRGSGKSNRLAMMQLTAASLQDSVDMGFTANSENTVKKYMDDKPKYIWGSLPDDMRSTADRNSTFRMFFGQHEKDQHGNTVSRGRNSNLICRAPTSNAFESLGLKSCAIDEAPKTKGLRDIFDMTDPCLADDEGFAREGFWWITGVAGDFDKHGQDFIEMWETAEGLGLTKIFIPGWAGMDTDEYGNEDVETAVRRILIERSKYKSGSKELSARIQQFPLTPDECFEQVGDSVMPVKSIRRSLQKLYTIPEMYRRVRLDESHSNPRLIDDQKGDILLLEGPQPNCAYAPAVDPFGYKMKFTANNQPGAHGEGSSGGLVIHKADTELPDVRIMEIEGRLEDPDLEPEERLQLHLSLGNMPVLYYLAKPQNPDVFAAKAAAIIRIFGWRAMVERIPSNVIEYMLNNGMKEYLFWEPYKVVNKQMKASDYSHFGMKVDEYWAGVRLRLLYSWYEYFSERNYFPQLAEHALHYNPAVQRKKFDDVDAHGMCLILRDDPRFTQRMAKTRGQVIDDQGGYKLPFRTTRPK